MIDLAWRGEEAWRDRREKLTGEEGWRVRREVKKV